MKKVKNALLAVFLLSSFSLLAQEKSDSIKVWGNCGMCKSRIEKAAKAEGATEAFWNKETKMLSVTYDASKTSNDAIQKKVASVGHDTEKFMADDKVYSKLPGCCLYDRKGSTETKKSGSHDHK